MRTANLGRAIYTTDCDNPSEPRWQTVSDETLAPCLEQSTLPNRTYGGMAVGRR